VDGVARGEQSRERRTAEFLSGGGDMGALMRTTDWSQTALGPVADWPQSLRTSVGLCLACAFPILVWWGPDLIMLYNDDYRAIIGRKHPRALGRPGRECWREIWHIIGPMLESVLRTGEATRAEDLPLLLETEGYPEERYFSFSFSPIRDEGGFVRGVFTPAKETTDKIIRERRLRTLRDLAAHMPQARDVETVCRLGAEVLAANPCDVPFALLYRASADGGAARLAASAGIEAGAPAAPGEIALGGDDIDISAVWPLARVARNGRVERVDCLFDRFKNLPCGAWAIPPTATMVLPVAIPGIERATAWLVVAISPHRQSMTTTFVFSSRLAPSSARPWRML
jgi:PAS fold